MRRSLIHYWRINVAVLLGAAVATAVLTGALLVGDSVRGSLRDLTLERLGKIDYALVSQRFFREDLALDLAQSPEFKQNFDSAAPAILLNGTVIHSQAKTRASQVNIQGIDDRFVSFFSSRPGFQILTQLSEKPPGQVFPSIIINQALQNELQAEVGDQILISVQKPSEIHRGSLLGSKATDEVVETLRLTLTHIIPDKGIGRFGLRPHQTLPLNAYVALPVLQNAVGQENRGNAIFVSQPEDVGMEDRSATLQKILHDALKFEDPGLKLSPHQDSFILESEEAILSPQVVQTADSVIRELRLPHLPVFTYLANSMRARGNFLPYSSVTSINTAAAEIGSLMLKTGQPAPALSGQDILLNEWAARDLNVSVGDSITMTYYTVGSRDELNTEQSVFVLKGIVQMSGLAADPELTPDFPGIAKADNMAEWDPPFPIDLSLIRQKDEDYWDKYRATPKAFVALETGQKLWGSRFGSLTSIRIASIANSTASTTAEQFKKKFLEKMSPEQFDLVFQPVKKQGLASSSGATDFSTLFIGFSLFLIVSAALLVGLLFRLGVEQRANEIGVLLSVGYPLKKVRRQFLFEGGILAVMGALLGLVGAIFYAWLLMVGLRTWWLAAVGTPFLFLHVQVLSLVLGFLISLVVIFFSIWLGFRRLSKIPAPALLAGVTTSPDTKRAGRIVRGVAFVSLILAIFMSVAAVAVGMTSNAGLFFGVGTLLLISGLAFFSIWLRSQHKPITGQKGLATLMKMAARNSPRNPGRSMLSAALVGCACFVIVAVGANRRDFGKEVLQKDSGAGGFAIIAESNIPLHHDLNSTDGRYELGFSDEDSEFLRQAEIIPFRLRPGDDASCLNLYRPQKPRILGVPEEQIRRGGFRFSATSEVQSGNHADPWSLLEAQLGDDIVPAFGDANSVQWILHSGLGKDLIMTNGYGKEIKLRFVGLLKTSIFQSELLISEANFLKHFPAHSGYSYFLIDVPGEKMDQTSQILESTLSDYGLDVTTSAERLANFQAVENTYLSTFQTLGGLGLLLGTLGLGIILIRNVIERRGEFATLRAFGYRRATLVFLVLTENGFLLALGMLMGTLSAVIAVAPHVLADTSQVPWLSLTMTLIVIFVVGMLASSAAVSVALRIPLLPALKAE